MKDNTERNMEKIQTKNENKGKTTGSQSLWQRFVAQFRKPWIWIGIAAVVVALVVGLSVGLAGRHHNKTKDVLTKEQKEFFDSLKRTDTDDGKLTDSFVFPEGILAENQSFESIWYVGKDYVVAQVKTTVVTSDIQIDTYSVEVFDRQNNFARVLGGAALQGNNYGFEGRVGDNMVLSRSDVFGTRTEETYAMLSLATKEYVEGFEFGEWDEFISEGNLVVFGTQNEDKSYEVCMWANGEKFEHTAVYFFDIDTTNYESFYVYTVDKTYIYMMLSGECKLVAKLENSMRETVSNSLCEINGKGYSPSIRVKYYKLPEHDKVLVVNQLIASQGSVKYESFILDISSNQKEDLFLSNQNIVDVKIYDAYTAFCVKTTENDSKWLYYKNNKLIFENEGSLGYCEYSTEKFLVFKNSLIRSVFNKKLERIQKNASFEHIGNQCAVISYFNDEKSIVEYSVIDSEGNNLFGKNFSFVSGIEKNKAFVQITEKINGVNTVSWYVLDFETKSLSKIKNFDNDKLQMVYDGYTILPINNNGEREIIMLNGQRYTFDECLTNTKKYLLLATASSYMVLSFEEQENPTNNLVVGAKWVEIGSYNGEVITTGWNNNSSGRTYFDQGESRALKIESVRYDVQTAIGAVSGVRYIYTYSENVGYTHVFCGMRLFIELGPKNGAKDETLVANYSQKTELSSTLQKTGLWYVGSYYDNVVVRVYVNANAHTYTVNFNGNGATGGSTAYLDMKYGTSKRLTANGFYRNGYTFLGWSRLSTATTETYGNEAIVANLTSTDNGTVTLYAVWAPNTIQITLNTNGGSGGTDYFWYKYNSYKFYSNPSLTSEISSITLPTKTGYTFYGYRGDGLNGGYNGELFIRTDGTFCDDLHEDIYKDATLYADWSAIWYTIKFDGNGATSGSMSNLSMTYDVAKNLTPNGFLRTGYTFVGWSADKNAASVKYADKARIEENLTAENGGVVTLYAVWAPNIYNGDNLVGHCYGGSLTIDNSDNNSFTVSGVGNAWIYGEINGKSNFDRVLQVQYYDGSCHIANLVGESTSGTTVARKIYKTDGKKIGDLTISINGVKFSVSSGSFDLPLKILFKNVHELKCAPNGGTFNGSTNQTSLLVVEGEKYSEVLKTEPTRDGYIFANWWTAESGGTQVLTTTIMGAQDVTIYAHWTAGTDTKYKVEHYLENTTKNGYVLQDTDNLTGTTNTNTAAVAKKYEGFTAGPVVQEKINGDGSTVITINYTRNVYSISFVGNGETSGSMNDLPMVYDVAKKLPKNGFLRVGYKFLGWSTNANATSTTYEDQESVSNLTSENNKTIILYAVWQANKYTIKFDGNGATSGSMSNLSMTYDVAKNLTANAFLRAGYTFVGWSTNANASTARYTNGQNVNNLTAENNGVVTLYAVWNPNDGTNYVVKHYLQNIDGTYGEADSTENYTGTTDTLVSPDVKKFVGFKSPNVITINISGDGSTVCEYYYERKSYVLTFNYNGNGQSNTTSTLKYGQEYGTLPTPTRVGYEFAGWWTAKSGGTQVSATTKMGAGNTTIYAHWTANKYTIKFDGNGKTSGSMADLSMTYDVAKNLTANGFLRTGYTFVGWSADKNAASVAHVDQASVENLTAENDGIVTLYAVWAANKYKINFVGNSATSGSMADLSMVYDVAKKLPKNEFLRTGYTFVGWSTDANATSAIHVDQANVVNLTAANDGVVALYAVWQVETYRINFVVGADETLVGVSYIDVEFGEAFGVLPTAVTSEFGMHFSHWVLNNERISKDTVARDFGENGTELEAVPVFVANEISVVFYPNLPSELGMSYDSVTRSYVFGAGNVCPNVDMFSFANMNLVFEGWALTSGGDVAIEAGEGLWNEWFANHEAVRNLYAVFSFEVEFNFGAPEFGPKIDAQVERWLSNKTGYGLPNVENHRLYDGLGWFVDETQLSVSNFFAVIINGANASSAARVEVLFAWQAKEFEIVYVDVSDTGDTVVGAVNSNVVKYTCESGSVALSALADVDKFHFMGFVIDGDGRYVADGFVSEVPVGADTLGDIVVYCNWLRLYSIEVRYRDLAMGAETVMFVGLDGSISSEKLSIWRDGFRMPVLALGSFVTKIKGDDGSIYIGVAYGNVKFRCKGIEKDGTRIAGDGTGNVDFVNSSISVKPNGDVVIEFVYVQRVVLSFNPDGGSAVDAVEMDVDTSIADEMARRGVNAWTQDKVSARDGFVFGWWETADGTRVESVRGLEIGENTILKAHWLAEVGFEVVDQNGNKLDVDADVLPGQIVELGTKVKDLDIWRRWAVSGNVDNDKYFAHYKVGVNFYLIGGKLYRVDPGCIDETIIAQNCVVQIRVIERVELTFVTDASDTKNGFVLHMASSFEEYNKDAWAEKLIYLQSGNAVGDSYQFVLNMDIAQEVEFFVIKYTRRGQNADGELVEFRLVSWADANGNVVLSGGSNARVFEAFASATLYANWVEAKGVSVGEFDGTGVHFADELIGYPQGDQILEFVLNGNVLEAVLVDGDNRTVVATMVCDNIVVDGETYRVVGFILSRSEVFDLFAEAVTTPNVVASTTIFPAAADGGNLFLYLAYEKV